MSDASIDLQKYFTENAGADNKLSWEEIQKAPIRDSENAMVVEISYRAIFDVAQNTKFDGDPNNLNYREFVEMFRKMEIKVPYHYGSYHSDISRELPHCDEQTVLVEIPQPPKKIEQLRAAIRSGIANALLDSWLIKRREIEQAIQEGKLAVAFAQLTDYFPIVATTAHYYNPLLESLCYTGCVDSLFEIEEFASPQALRIGTIKSFWRDVEGLLGKLLDKAESQGIKDLAEIWKGKTEQEKIRYYDEADVDYAVSDYTLMSLLEKTAPKLVKRIAHWGKT